jgi:hypothetical protein
MRRNLSTTFAWILILLSSSCLVSAGCRESGTATVVPVKGKVLLDGEPLKFGSVTLQPTRGQPARGDIRPDGEFTLSTYSPGDGAPIGRHTVKVTCYTSQDPAAKKDAAAGATGMLGESLIPDRYTRFDSSGLEISILAGSSTPYVIELESDAKETASPIEDAEEEPAAESSPPPSDAAVSAPSAAGVQ